MKPTSRKPAERAVHRLGPLSKLPVFLDLAGKRAVVAGGTAAAAWKAELLAAAGADVDVYARNLDAEMAALLARGAAAGRLRHHACEWSPDILAGAAIALADVESDDAAQAFHDAAVAVGAAVNVIDKPAYCQFQTGSIVNRSPVVVGISTNGAAPILGQAIRRRIETLLPPAVAEWGRFAKAIREMVNRTLEPGAQRRRFWERVAERAFGAPPSAFDRATLLDDMRRIGGKANRRSGRVSLVGAGPGDPELLTLKAVRTLQSADIILFDDLVSGDVLELARREAKRLLVGKRGGRASCAQEDINALMVKLAKQGKHVVRLKSGDPVIFGRAGEEIAALRREGIDVLVVPGITAASAMASTVGTSLTHRDQAHSVRFITGHSRQGVLPEELDWHGIADPETTLVFYMGARTAPQISSRLISCGLAPETAAVIMSAVSRPDQTCWQGTLRTLGDGIAAFDRAAPVILGIGAVFEGARAASGAIADFEIASPLPLPTAANDVTSSR